jgi:lipopolysaccharide export system permease protein
LFLAAINFVILGVAVSSVKPRVGRSTNLVFSLFAFVLYFNLLNLGQSWIASGKFSFLGFLLTVHGGAFVIGSLWLARGHHNWHWRQLSGLRRTNRTLPIKGVS